MTRLNMLFFWLNLTTVTASYGQVVIPSVQRSEVPYCEIVQVERSSKWTKVYFRYTAPETFKKGGGVCAGSGYFIRDVRNGMKYRLINVDNIPECPEKFKFRFQGQTLNFNLTFEALPSSATLIDIMEDGTIGGFNFFNVDITIAQADVSNPEPTTFPLPSFPDDCDSINVTPQSIRPNFEKMLAGVKYAVIVNSPEINGHVPAFNALIEYLYGMGFESVEYLNENYEHPSDLCEEIYVELGFAYNLEDFYNITMTFANIHTGYVWEFTTRNVARAGLYSDPKYNFGQVLLDMYNFPKGTFNSSETMHLATRQTCWTESKLKEHIQREGCDEIEGIYENVGSSDKMAKYKVAVKKINGTYHVIYLSGAMNSENWHEGEVKATLEPSATPLLYKANWVMADKSENTNYYITFERGLFNLFSGSEKNLYIKMFPLSADYSNNSSSAVISSGTGYAISSDGYIITNYHVTNDARSIKVRGVNGDFSKSYSASVIVTDEINDLSIIKIADSSFTSLGTIPYVIADRASDVGSSVFVLGYPLRASMGEEVKLTDGIISSKTGFKGDVSSYQISAPVQPGNSGGPVFDEKGNIIGIINSKHLLAENASYAIKASFILNLIDLIPSPPKLQTSSLVAGKPLTEQVKILRKYTYIIEVN